MSIILKNGEMYLDGKLQKKDCMIDHTGKLQFNINESDTDEILDCSDMLILPGLLDPHVHLREPGFEYKATIASETNAMAKGGYTTVFSMPNLNPVPDTLSHMEVQLNAIKKDSKIHVIPYGAITKGEKGTELSDMKDLSEVTVGFSDDGKGVQKEEMMRSAMTEAASLNRVIVAHCEDESLIEKGACIHKGKKATEFNLIGISSESEYKQIERDIKLSEETGCHYHVCHISCKESVELIRQAKAKGLPVTCEVTVHHLLMNEEDITYDHGNFKMNPPLRSKEDQQALIDGLNDGTIDMICTDHAPHSAEEKSKGLQNSMMGITSSEYAFLLIYTYLVKTNKVKLETVLDAMTIHCADRFHLLKGRLTENEKADLTIFDFRQKETISEENLLTKGKNTPFINQTVDGKCVLTVCDGKIVYRRDI